MRGNMLKRRTQFLNAICKGTPLKETVEQFSEDYGVAAKTLYNDWAKRSEWLPQVVQVQDSSGFFEMYQGLKEVLRCSWLLQITSANESVRIAALKLVKDTYLDLFKILKDLDFIKRETLERKQPIKELELLRERSRQIIEEMSEEQLKDMMNALKPFEGLIDFPAESSASYKRVNQMKKVEP